MEVRTHDAEREVALDVFKERVVRETATEDFLPGNQERRSKERADRRTGNREAGRVTERLGRPDPWKRLECGGQRVSHEVAVVTREWSARPGALGDKPESIQGQI